MMARARVTVTLDRLAHGGEAVGRLPDGKVCFVGYGVPGETVVVELTEDRARFARGTVVEVSEPSPHRATPPCPHFGPGRCGGCRLQHIVPEHQAELLRQVVADQLQRIGRIPDPPVAPTVRPHPGDGLGYRNAARMTPDPAGRLGYRRAGSHEVEPVERCPLLEPAVQAARDAVGDAWAGVRDMVFRADADGRSLVEIHPGEGGVPDLPPAELPVALVGAGSAVALRGDPSLTERVAGHELRVSPTSFFQASRAAAGALVELVLEGAGAGPGDTVLDCYAGVGLFSVALAAAGADVHAVESHPAAAADAAHNLQPYGGHVERRAVEDAARDWAATGRQADVVVLDPPRRGAGPELSTTLAGLARRRIVYVACDPAALARDARALGDAGWRLERAVPVDQFTHTAHVEVVATLSPGAP